MVVTSKPSWARIFRQVGPPLVVIAVIAIVAAVINAIDHPFKAIVDSGSYDFAPGGGTWHLVGFSYQLGIRSLVGSEKALGCSCEQFPFACAGRRSASYSRRSADLRDEARHHARNLVYHQIAFVHALRLGSSETGAVG